MQIEQRHVTTVNLLDGKPREVAILRESRGCKVCAVAQDEVLNVLMSTQDFHKLAQTLAHPAGTEARESTPGHATEAVTPPAVTETTTPGWTTIRVDQRQVTTVALHPARPRDFFVARDDRGYKVTCVSKEEVVTFLLSLGDFSKLRHQILALDTREGRRENGHGHRTFPEVRHDAPETQEVRRPHTGPALSEGEVVLPGRGEPVPYPWGSLDWLGFN